MPSTSAPSSVASCADPYPAPHPASTNEPRNPRSRISRMANRYRARCSLKRLSSTSPGITRSPVNSALSGSDKPRLLFRRFDFFPKPRVQLHPAWHSEIAVDLAVGMRHLRRDRVVDPIAHLVGIECPVRNRGAEGKGARIQFGNI